jgi:hypothetical protein
MLLKVYPLPLSVLSWRVLIIHKTLTWYLEMTTYSITVIYVMRITFFGQLDPASTISILRSG